MKTWSQSGLPGRLLKFVAVATVSSLLAACASQQSAVPLAPAITQSKAASPGVHKPGGMHTMGWNGCGSGETGAGCRTQPPDDGGNVWVPGGCATAYDPGSGLSASSCTSGYYESICSAAGISGGCLFTGSSPCMPITSCASGAPVAYRPPTDGAACWNSPGTLGDNIPSNSNDPNSEIINILVLVSNNGTNSPDNLAWEYITKNGDWLQINPTFNAFWSTLISSLPVVGGIGQALAAGGLVQPSSLQWSSIMGYLNSHNGFFGRCFSTSLPA